MSEAVDQTERIIPTPPTAFQDVSILAGLKECQEVIIARLEGEVVIFEAEQESCDCESHCRHWHECDMLRRVIQRQVDIHKDFLGQLNQYIEAARSYRQTCITPETKNNTKSAQTTSAEPNETLGHAEVGKDKSHESQDSNWPLDSLPRFSFDD